MQGLSQAQHFKLLFTSIFIILMAGIMFISKIPKTTHKIKDRKLSHF